MGKRNGDSPQTQLHDKYANKYVVMGSEAIKARTIAKLPTTGSVSTTMKLKVR